VPKSDIVHLLDLEPDLAARLREDDRAEAYDRLVLPVVELPEGAWSLSDADQQAHPFGLVVIDGLLLQEVELGGRRSDRLLGRGDIVLPHRRIDATLRADPQLIVATPARVALLDDRLQAPFALWPGLALGLMEQTGRQLTRSAVLAAIAQLPRVEDRLEAVFWDLADRWGRVTPTGIHIPLRLTHETLARIAGGRRPTISLALTQLAEREILARRDDGTWLMTATVPSLMTPPDDDDAAVAAPPTAPPLALVLPEPEPARRPLRRAPAWPQAMRSELLESTQRALTDHQAAVERVRADALRYAETRERSRRIRAEAEQVRARRDEHRSVLGLLRTAPSAPAP
jgi:CRP/FNR family transcriptional regulator, cyclic AMP receptor protein